MRTVDLRSDTVTQPTPRMRELMSKAVVGDDVYQEDPTVNQLEAYGAELVGKEAALFVASGTMGNLVALMTHTHPGEEVILEAEAHIYYYEVGGLCRIAGLVPHLLPGEGGIFTPEQLKKALRPANIHYPKTTLLCLENTHNRAGGRVLPQGQVEEIAEIAKEAGLKLHLDGARIFNAAAASGIDVKTLAAPFDSVMFCLSKGLAAPAGSLLAGSAEFIARARKNRKILGGGMRQAGSLGGRRPGEPGSDDQTPAGGSPTGQASCRKVRKHSGAADCRSSGDQHHHAGRYQAWSDGGAVGAGMVRIGDQSHRTFAVRHKACHTLSD